MENLRSVHDPRLRDVLATETKRQQRSYRRVTLLIGGVVLLGVAWLAFSAFNVIKLERRGSKALAEFAALEQASVELQQKIKDETQELEMKRAELRAIKTMLDAGRNDDARRLVSSVVNEKNPQDQIPEQRGAPGFVGDYDYRGPEKAVITVEVIPDRSLLESPTRPKTLYTYALDGRNYFNAPPGNKITFSLDKAANPRRLELYLDFADPQSGGYTIKLSASAGSSRSRTFAVRPDKTGEPRTRRFFFHIT